MARIELYSLDPIEDVDKVTVGDCADGEAF